MTLYDDTVRLVNARIADKLGRRRNQLAYALEQAIERQLDGDAVDKVEVPQGTDASEVADSVREGKPVPQWAQPLVSDLGQDDVWVISPKDYHFLNEKYRRYVVTDGEPSDEDLLEIVNVERTNRDADDREDFVVNVWGSGGNTELTVPNTRRSSSKKRADPDDEKVTVSQEKHVSKRTKVMVEKFIADSSEKTGQQVGLLFRDFTEEFKQVLRDEMAKHWEEVKLTLQPAQPRRRRGVVHGPSGTLRDLEDFFEELRDEGMLVPKKGGRVYVHRSLVPLWRTFMTARTSSYVEVKDSTLGKELRDLCSGADDLPDDHPARSMQLKKQYCLVGWDLSTDDEE